MRQILLRPCVIGLTEIDVAEIDQPARAQVLHAVCLREFNRLLRIAFGLPAVVLGISDRAYLQQGANALELVAGALGQFERLFERGSRRLYVAHVA